MMNRHYIYKSQTDPTYTVVLFIAISFTFIYTCAVAMMFESSNVIPMWSSVPLLLMVLYLVILPTKLKYTLDGNDLKFKNGFITKQIRVEDIKSIRFVDMWSNLKFRFATGTSGLKIYLKNGQAFLINPENEKGFINELMLLNNRIELI